MASWNTSLASATSLRCDTFELNPKKPTKPKYQIDLTKDIQKATREIDRQIKSTTKNTNRINPISYHIPKPIRPIRQPLLRTNIRPIRQYTNLNQVKLPTLENVVNWIKQKRIEQQKRDQILEEQKRQRFQNIIKFETRQESINRENYLYRSIANAHEEISKQKQKISKIENDVNNVKDVISTLKEKVSNLESYKTDLQEGISKLLKIKENGLNNSELINVINNLLTEKQKIEEQIGEINSILEDVVKQQEKDVPFNQSLRRLDDKRFNDQV